MALLSEAQRADTGSTSPPQFRLGYRPELDGLRAIAVVLVMLHHMGDLIVPGMIDWLAPGGYLGVDIFFVLSGFLITALLLGEWRGRGNISWGHFLLRRALRLLPALLAFLGVYLVVSLAAGLHTYAEARGSVLWALTYVQNWSLVSLPHTNEVAQTWSLAVEAQFYVAWSLVVLALAKLHVRRGFVALAAIAGIVASAAWRMHDYGTDHNWLRVYVRTFDRADSLLVGCLVAVAVNQGWLRPRERAVRSWRALQALALAALLFLSWRVHADDPMLYRGLFTVVAALAGVVILGALFGGRGALNRVLASPLAVAVGKISYALYLWHYAVFFVLRDHADSWPTWARVVVAVVAPFALSSLSYWLVERPFLRLKRARAAARAVAPAAW